MGVDVPGPTGAVVVDFQAPQGLVVRWGLLAAVCTMLELRLASITSERALTDDGGGNWAALDFLGDGRFGFSGFDHEYSETTDDESMVDVLEDGPDWLEWKRLSTDAEQDQLGWCFWYENGRWWQSGSAARSGLPDGHQQAARFVLTDEAARELITDLPTWCDQECLAPGVAEGLLERARTGQLTADDLRPIADLSARPAEALDRGLQAGAAAGLTPGSQSPSQAPGAASPGRPPRRRRRLSESAHQQHVLDVMRRAAELPRPEPPSTPALIALTQLLRDRDLLTTAGAPISIQICGGGSTMRPPVGLDLFSEIVESATLLRDVEADPRRGRWIWLQIREIPARLPLRPPRLQVNRAYDHIPDWWTGEQYQMPWLSNLRTEMDDRDPAYRPDWVHLLDPNFAWEQL
jgi:hypothetical protein